MSKDQDYTIRKVFEASNVAAKATKAAIDVENIFTKTYNKVIHASKSVDTGLRSTVSGALYSDKSIFYKRPEVLKALAAVKDAVPDLIHSETDKIDSL
jgi:hypothetical protein